MDKETMSKQEQIPGSERELKLTLDINDPNKDDLHRKFEAEGKRFAWFRYGESTFSGWMKVEHITTVYECFSKYAELKSREEYLNKISVNLHYENSLLRDDADTWKAAYKQSDVEVERLKDELAKTRYNHDLAVGRSEDQISGLERANAALQSRLDAVSGALREILPPEGMEGWWCPSCKSEVDATFHEHCATCGTFIGDKQPGTDWVTKARAALASIGEGVV